MTKKQLISPLETEGCHFMCNNFQKHFKHQKVRPAVNTSYSFDKDFNDVQVLSLMGNGELQLNIDCTV